MKSYRRPNLLLYLPLVFLLKLYAFIKGQRIVQKVKINKPCIVLSNHTSFYDFIYTTTAVFPFRINYLAADKMFYDPTLGFFLRLARAIPKCLFQQDLLSIRASKKILEQKGIIGIFPEGQISSIGRTLKPPFAIAKLIKKMNVDVYVVRHENAYFVNPPWTKKNFSGKILTKTIHLFQKNNLPFLSDEEIYESVWKELYYDAGSYNKQKRLKYKPNDISNLESLIYQCPSCGHMGLVSKKTHLSCLRCGYQLVYNQYGLLNDYTIGELYDRQAALLHQQIDSSHDFILESNVTLESYRQNRVVVVGKGKLTLTKDRYCYVGIIDHEEVTKIFYVKNIPYLPSDIGKNIQIYYDYQLYQFVFDDKYLPIQFVIAGEYLYEKNNLMSVSPKENNS